MLFQTTNFYSFKIYQTLTFTSHITEDCIETVKPDDWCIEKRLPHTLEAQIVHLATNFKVKELNPTEHGIVKPIPSKGFEW